MGNTRIRQVSRFQRFKNYSPWKIALIVFLILLVGLLIFDIAGGTRRYDRGMIKDLDYTPAKRTCDDDGNCSTTKESCEVFVAGDDYRGWADMDCFYFHRYARLNDLVDVTWIEGNLSGLTWLAKVY
jgi:hypothetical protein